MYRSKNIKSLIVVLLLLFSDFFSQTSDNTPIEKWAYILVNYSLNLQPEETILIRTDLLANELCLAVYKEALLKGAYPTVHCTIPGLKEILFRNASDKQLKHVNPIDLEEEKYYDAFLRISAPANTKELSNIESERLTMFTKSQKEWYDIFFNRLHENHIKWCLTEYPTNALAQEAEMGLHEYTQFIYQSCKLDQANPGNAWQKESIFQQILCDWLKNKEELVIKGPNIDMKMGIKGRLFLKGDGKVNFPDGEIYISPIENSSEGWVKFSFPTIENGQEINDIQLWFKEGKVIKEKAKKGDKYLTDILNTDDGSRVLGELGIGTNYNIKKYTNNILFDEKMGGTIHLAVGLGIPETGGKNKSSIHWDMLYEMSQSEIIVDGKLFYKNGQFVNINN
jgi:aminopeptidase